MKVHDDAQLPALSRRGFLKAGVAAMVAAALPGHAWATMAKGGERRLSFHHLHTGETLNTVYWAEGAYQSEGLAEINRVLRDFRTGEVSPISTGLLDLLHVLSASLDTAAAFEVISGYRSPATNAMLAEKGSGVAKHSLHMEGLAIDIRIPGRQLKDLQRAALALQGGGVGYYPVSDFVHVDVGRVRHWVG